MTERDEAIRRLAEGLDIPADVDRIKEGNHWTVGLTPPWAGEVVPHCPRCGALMPSAPYDPGVCTIEGCPCGGGPWALYTCQGCNTQMAVVVVDG